MTTTYRPLWPTPKKTKIAVAVKTVLARGLMASEYLARKGERVNE